MIDFLKIVIFDRDLIDKVWNNPLLEYFSEKTKRISKDEVIQTNTKSYKNMMFEKHQNCLIISGSIHKFFNDGIHNANDFSFVNSIGIILFLTENLNLDLSKCIVQNLEFGLNILPKTAINNILNWSKYHERNEFIKDPELQYSKRSQTYNSSGIANNYKVIKAYNKGQQKFNGRTYADPNTFRFEVRSKQAKYFNQFGIYTLADLINPEIYLVLANELIKEFEKVLILEKQLHGIEKKLDKFLDSDFWENCLPGHRNMFAKQKKIYFELLNHYPETIHSELKQLIKSKLDLFTIELKTGAISTTSSEGLKVQFPKYISRESAPVYNLKVAVGLTIHNQQLKLKYCPITKVDISMQKGKSKLLSVSGLKWLNENDPKKYREIERCFLPNWGISGKHTKYESNRFYHLAHQIRNEYYNHRKKIHLPDNQFSLEF